MPSTLILALDGIAAGLVALLAFGAGLQVAPLAIAVAIGILLSARTLSPARPWSLRLASYAAAIGSPAWLLLLAATENSGDVGLSITCLCIAAGSIWASGFLHHELAGELPILAEDRSGTPSAALADWIEEVPPTLSWTELAARGS